MGEYRSIYETYRPYINFIKKYRVVSNASTGSKFDSNANVENKNVTTLTGELPKELFIGINRLQMGDKLLELYGEDISEEYLRQLDKHEIYKHDETNPELPYCVSITMYPFLFNGMKEIGGISTAPKNLQSFCGSFVNLVFAIAAQFAGAVSTPEFLTYMDYFIRLEYGDDYYKHPNKQGDCSKKQRSIDDVITQYFQEIVYSLNQPAAARNYQSVFWNIAYFDKAYFNNIFENFVFPDGSAPQYESVVWLQKRFMSWFNQERLRTILTFPVETANSLIIENEDGSISFGDEDFADYIAEMWSKGHSFFWYNSDSVDSLASCCFDGSQKIKCRDKNGEYECSFKELSEMDIDSDTLEVPIYQKWAKCKLITLPKRQMYKISIGEHEVICTDNHLFPVGKSDSFECIDKEAKDIQVGNKIPVYDFNTKTSIGIGVTSIKKCDGTSSMVYCFEMENQDNPYFMLANGVITHNCRLRNELQDNTFSYTLGAGGVSTGSKCVITINFNRLVQDVYKKPEEYSQDTNHQKLDEAIRAQVKKIHKYLIAYNAILEDSLNANLMSVYNAGYISMNKQFLTIGINGLVEGAEYLGIDISPNDDYFNYCTACLKPIYEENKKAKTKEIMFNTEYVPAENLGVKNAKWDKEDGYFSPRDCYNSYFYRPEDNSLSVIDKLILHGKKTTQWLDGGSALHMNLEEHLTKEQYKKIMLDAAKVGCSYLTFNVPNTVCKDCGYISKHKFDRCPQCGSENVDWATRIIGYLKLISKFSEQRQIEANKRYYINATEQITT